MLDSSLAVMPPCATLRPLGAFTMIVPLTRALPSNSCPTHRRVSESLHTTLLAWG